MVYSCTSAYPCCKRATRPLAIRENGVWYTYGWDLTKNICELYGQEGFIRTIYTYSPYGQVTAEGDVTQCIQWSSEMYDAELGLAYYNYRYYNPRDGRWTRRDPDVSDPCDYLYAKSNPCMYVDFLGTATREQREQTRRRRAQEQENNRRTNKFNKNIPPAFQGATDGVSALNEIYEFIAAIRELLRDSKTEEHMKGVAICQESLKQEKCGCCYIYLNCTQSVWGQANYGVYTLREVKITPGFTCEKIDSAPGYYPLKTVYDSGLQVSGVPRAEDPQQIIYPPVFIHSFGNNELG